jgi:hypothetical protein
MAQKRHKGTEFSNVKRIWEENEKSPDAPKEIGREANDFSNVSDTWDENEKKKEMPSNEDAFSKIKESWETNERDSSGSGDNNYWGRISNDPAHGYKNEGSDNPQLNPDQEPGDHERGSGE